jgi:hypothetical protein
VIRFVEVPLGTGGGVRCGRCSAEEAEESFRPAEEVIADAAAACASWSEGAGPNVRLSGAEPFAHPELPRVISGVVASGCQRLGIDTDAVGLRSPANARGALVAGVRHVRITVLAGTEGVHDALAGAPGLLDAMREGVGVFRAAAEAEGLDVSVTVLVPVCRHNAHDLPSAVGVGVECGADRVEVRVTDGGLDLASAVPWITAACDTGVVNGVWVEVEGAPFCLLPGYDLHLSDAVRPRAGAKHPTCGACGLDAVCGGAPPGASADQLATLAAPAFAADLARRVARGRGTEAH